MNSNIPSNAAQAKSRPFDEKSEPLVPPEELDGLPSSAFAAKAFPGAKFVKGFNHLIAATLAADPVVEGGHRVVFLSSDDEDAVGPVADLAKQLGFAPVKLGKLNKGGALVHARGHIWGRSSNPSPAAWCGPRTGRNCHR